MVLGLVSAKRGNVEGADELVERVRRVAEEIAKGQGTTPEEVQQQNLAVSPECGFASVDSGPVGKRMNEKQQRANLAFLRDVARRIWKGTA